MTLGIRSITIMALKFEYDGVSFTADTPQEAAEMLEILKMKKETEAILRKQKEAEAFFERKKSRTQEHMQEFKDRIAVFDEGKFTWTPDYFTALIDRLGEPQKLALALLVTKKSLADEELRSALKVSGNQALAGILSGISKQAAALYIPARAVFNFENFRMGGKRRSDYLVSDEFRQIATSLNWPPPALLTNRS